LVDVGVDLVKVRHFSGFDLLEWAAKTGVFVRAGCSIWADTAAHLDAPLTEMGGEFDELRSGGCAVFFCGTQCSSALDELLVAVDHFLGIDHGVSHGGVEVLVPEQFRGDVDGSPLLTASVANSRRKSCGASPVPMPARSTALSRYSRRVPELNVRGRPARRNWNRNGIGSDQVRSC
jgi:hypothetical protein